MKVSHAKFFLLALALLLPGLLSASAIGTVSMGGPQVFVSQTTIDFTLGAGPNLSTPGAVSVGGFPPGCPNDFNVACHAGGLTVGQTGTIQDIVGAAIPAWITLPDPGGLFAFSLAGLVPSNQTNVCDNLGTYTTCVYGGVGGRSPLFKVEPLLIRT